MEMARWKQRVEGREGRRPGVWSVISDLFIAVPQHELQGSARPPVIAQGVKSCATFLQQAVMTKDERQTLILGNNYLFKFSQNI